MSAAPFPSLTLDASLVDVPEQRRPSRAVVIHPSCSEPFWDTHGWMTRKRGSSQSGGQGTGRSLKRLRLSHEQSRSAPMVELITSGAASDRLDKLPLITADTGCAIIEHPSGDMHDDRPRRPEIKPAQVFWRSKPTPMNQHRADPDLGMAPLTTALPDDPLARTIGVASSLLGKAGEGQAFRLTRADLVRYRAGFGPKDASPADRLRDRERGWEGWKGMSLAEACWRKWEEMGGVLKGSAGTLPFAYDVGGMSYKPDITLVQAIRLVIAASPKRMMTLSQVWESYINGGPVLISFPQIYQAMEERWPGQTTGGSTWKNSIRHNLSLNDCFVNVLRPANSGGTGKGGYWTVDDTLSGKITRKQRRSVRAANSDILPEAIAGQGHQAPVPAVPDTSSPARPGPIAHPATRVTTSYAIPTRPHDWIPDEVVLTSRTIGLSRPSTDIPLDLLTPPSTRSTADPRTKTARPTTSSTQLDTCPLPPVEILYASSTCPQMLGTLTRPRSLPVHTQLPPLSHALRSHPAPRLPHGARIAGP